MYQFSPFEVGQIKAHMHHGCNAETIRHPVTKVDGNSLWTHQAISDTMRKIQDDKSYRGDRTEGSGRKRKTRESDDNIGTGSLPATWLNKSHSPISEEEVPEIERLERSDGSKPFI